MTNTLRWLILLAIFGIGVAGGWFVNGWRLTSSLQAYKRQQAELALQTQTQAETLRLATQHQITKVEKVYIEKQHAQASVDKKIVENSNALPDAPLLPYPYRVLHDFAATGISPTQAPNPHGTDGDPIAPRTFAKTVVGNYATARDNARRLDALQEIVKASGCFDLTEATTN